MDREMEKNYYSRTAKRFYRGGHDSKTFMKYFSYEMNMMRK